MQFEKPQRNNSKRKRTGIASAVNVIPPDYDMRAPDFEETADRLRALRVKEEARKAARKPAQPVKAPPQPVNEFKRRPRKRVTRQLAKYYYNVAARFFIGFQQKEREEIARLKKQNPNLKPLKDDSNNGTDSYLNYL